MSADNAIIILTLTNTEDLDKHDYYVGHTTAPENLRYPDVALSFIKSQKVKKFPGDLSVIMKFANQLDWQYNGTEYGILTEAIYMLYTLEDLEKQVEINASNTNI